MAKENLHENRAMNTMMENIKVVSSMFSSNHALESAVRQANMVMHNSIIQSARLIADKFIAI
jgi:hypothetical protein